jgi:hypothetical protein
MTAPISHWRSSLHVGNIVCLDELLRFLPYKINVIEFHDGKNVIQN